MKHFWPTLCLALAASASAQTNLITNPGTVDLPDGGLSVAPWSPPSALGTVRWDNAGTAYANRSHSGPPDGGTGYFKGTGACGRAYQPVPIAPALAAFAPGRAQVTLGGWFGGWTRQEDRAEAIVRFSRLDGGFLGLLSVGPVTRAERADATGLFLREASARLPSEVAEASLELRCTRGSGDVNDGYFDELYLVVTADDGGAGALSQTEPPFVLGCFDGGVDAGAGFDGGAAPGDGGVDAGAGFDGDGGVDAGIDVSPATYAVGCGCSETGSATLLALLVLGWWRSARK